MAKLRIIDFEIGDEALASSVAMISAAFGNQAVPPPATAAPAIAAEPAPRAPARAIAAAPEAEARRPKAAKPPASPMAVETEPSPREGSIPARILAELAKGPKSSLELANALELEPKQVYTPCSMLKTQGAVKTRNDFPDGTSRYFLFKR